VARLPALWFILGGTASTRYYIDPISGQIVSKFDRDAQQYRWLHQSLHRLDFNATLRSHPLWDFLTLSLLSGVTFVCAVGVYLGFKGLVR
jgi:hypothetical protein